MSCSYKEALAPAQQPLMNTFLRSLSAVCSKAEKCGLAEPDVDEFLKTFRGMYGRQLLEKSCGKISDSALGKILDLATTDIKVNRIGYGQKTRSTEVVAIAERCHVLIRR